MAVTCGIFHSLPRGLPSHAFCASFSHLSLSLSLSPTHTHTHTHTHSIPAVIVRQPPLALLCCCPVRPAVWGRSMACRPPASASYTVVVLPLRTSLHSLDALRFFLWIKHLKDLEKEKDALRSGLEVLEKTRFWYLQRLEQNRARLGRMGANQGAVCSQEETSEVRSHLLRSLIQRVNGSLGAVMSEPNAASSSVPSLVDSDLQWRNTVLTQEVSDKNRRISVLELEKDVLLKELDELQTL
ncbi:suppressor APC domain-containing protein 2-like [Antennarius striatus]|uniref:suppressor APC domain-containing protein 2-like n=1 Tax=Antennarius striatus TaxID=241820 RepID=UPI0035B2ED88